MQSKRIQRKRTKGWTKPANTVNVTRPGKWGNPHNWKDEAATLATRASYLVLSSPAGIKEIDRQAKEQAVIDFAYDLKTGQLPYTAEDVRRELRGKNLMCWCAEDDPCHADVLLEIANS